MTMFLRMEMHHRSLLWTSPCNVQWLPRIINDSKPSSSFLQAKRPFVLSMLGFFFTNMDNEDSTLFARSRDLGLCYILCYGFCTPETER
jgi:hypothetical protein